MDPDTTSSTEKIKNIQETLAKERSFWRLPVVENLLKTFSSGDRLVLYALGSPSRLSTLALLAQVS
jgi:hypothetical protein